MFMIAIESFALHIAILVVTSLGCGKLPLSEDLGKQLGATPQSFGAKFGLHAGAREGINSKGLRRDQYKGNTIDM